MLDSSPQQKEFLDELVSNGLLIRMGVAGVYGRGSLFEDVIERFDAYVSRLARNDQAELIRFPPVVNRKDFERSGYLTSFPQLAGSIFSFEGSPEEHLKLMDLIHDGQDWSRYQKMTDVVLTPAACYPVYAVAAARGPIKNGGNLFDVFSYCFRHEPSGDPARMQIFRMREFVKIAAFDDILPWRDSWIERGMCILEDLGLGVISEVANDPFFGRGGRLLAANQREQRLKYELSVAICSDDKPTAVVSCNYHQDHFGHVFGLKNESGETAHTACVGFGMERIVLALFKTHGLDPMRWPAPVRERLWP